MTEKAAQAKRLFDKAQWEHAVVALEAVALGAHGDDEGNREARTRQRKQVALSEQRLAALVRNLDKHGFVSPQPASSRQWEGGVILRPVRPGGRCQ